MGFKRRRDIQRILKESTGGSYWEKRESSRSQSSLRYFRNCLCGRKIFRRFFSKHELFVFFVLWNKTDEFFKIWKRETFTAFEIIIFFKMQRTNSHCIFTSFSLCCFSIQAFLWSINCLPIWLDTKTFLAFSLANRWIILFTMFIFFFSAQEWHWGSLKYHLSHIIVTVPLVMTWHNENNSQIRNNDGNRWKILEMPRNKPFNVKFSHQSAYRFSWNPNLWT